MPGTITVDGLDITVYRREGLLVIDIDTSSLDEKDQWPNGVPKLTIRINEGRITVNEDGSTTDS